MGEDHDHHHSSGDPSDHHHHFDWRDWEPGPGWKPTPGWDLFTSAWKFLIYFVTFVIVLPIVWIVAGLLFFDGNEVIDWIGCIGSEIIATIAIIYGVPPVASKW